MSKRLFIGLARRHVTDFVLFSSVLAPEGSSYTVELRGEFSAQ